MGETSVWEETESRVPRERVGMVLGQAKPSPCVSCPRSQLVQRWWVAGLGAVQRVSFDRRRAHWYKTAFRVMAGHVLIIQLLSVEGAQLPGWTPRRKHFPCTEPSSFSRESPLA